MKIRSSVCVYACRLAVAGCALTAAPAAAQFGDQFKPQPMNEPASGERYHIEGAVGFWWPSANLSISSSQFNIVGTTIDFRNDLGLTDQRFPELSLVLRPAKAHKLRFQYIPIDYAQSAAPHRTIIFNGQRFDVSLPVNSEVQWKAYRFGYEFDFLTHNNWFAGFIVEAKYTDVKASLASPLASEFVRAQAPIPAIGGIGRYYIVPGVSITGEVTAFKIPTVQDKYGGHFADVDIYGTVNWTNNVGTQIGYRDMDVAFLVKRDSGAMTLKGFYVAVVARY
jgi:hypothetical protein